MKESTPKKPYEEEQDRNRLTKGYEKIWTYLDRLTDSADFQNWVRYMRKKYSLPPTGIKNIEYGLTLKGEKFITFPKHLRKTNFADEVGCFSSDYGLTLEWSLIIENYVVYNNLEMDSTGSMFETFDLRYDLVEAKPLWVKKEITDFLKDSTKTHPIAILLSPYASERDIVDYVKKVYKVTIEPKLNKYKNPKVIFGKVRRRQQKVKDRENFIYENRNLPKKKIVELVGEKFGEAMDYTYINTIIRNKKKNLGQ